MKYVERKGIHTRLNFIIKHSGGFDPVFNANKLMKEYNISKEVSQLIGRYTNIRDYINEYGIDDAINTARLKEEKRQRESKRSMNELAVMLTGISSMMRH